ncbi:MAG: ABC transporter ATP-binding protein [Nitrospirae bacterium]|nr:ABC transporter ATP-binding protein [Nitrospirota bacterium]
MAQIHVADLRKVYAVGDQTITAVDRVSLVINKGEFVSIVGHSGSGKTTLLSIVGGIMKPNSGQVLFEGEDICSFDDDRLSEYRNEKVGFMFQFASLLPMLTAVENVMLPGLFRKARNTGGHARAAELLGMVGIGDRCDAYPSQLSGGQQRRVAIARALMYDPRVILADEPTGDLDEETENDIMQLFRRLNSEREITFIFITHNLDLAAMAQRRLRMTHGILHED